MRKTFVFVLSFILLGAASEMFLGSACAQNKKTIIEKENSSGMAFPDGTVGRRYDFVIVPADFSAPFKVSLLSGSMPVGLTVNQKTGGIEGQPSTPGKWGIALKITDAKSRRVTLSGDIRVWRSLTVGVHGQFKGADGFQMALNMAQDMDEILIEQGYLEVTGLVIPQSKNWTNGIKITGGWNETFAEKSKNPEDTIIDGGGKERCILTISNRKGTVYIENMTFKNSKRGAIKGKATYTNCVFTDNMDSDSLSSGGAVKDGGIFTNCLFTDNSATTGGAVNGGGTFTNCEFKNNTAGWGGGAVAGGGTFTHCIFTNNSADVNYSGGAVSDGGNFADCVFTNNSAGDGGAVAGGGFYSNCAFINNSAKNDGGAVNGRSSFFGCAFVNNTATDGGAVSAVTDNGSVVTFNDSVFINNSAMDAGGFGSGGAVKATGNYINCSFYGNKAGSRGGAVSGGGEIINSIFYKNSASEKDNDITSDGNLKIDYSLFNYLSGAADIGAKIIMGDPKFSAPDKGDLHLLPDSPCIGKGKPLASRVATAKAVNMGANETVLLSALENYKNYLKKPVVAGSVNSEAQKTDGAAMAEDSVTAQGIAPSEISEAQTAEDKQIMPTVNKSIVGTWRGTVNQPGEDSYYVSVRFMSTDSGSIEYPSVNCAGTLSGGATGPKSYQYTESITSGKCISGIIVAKLNDDNTLSCSWATTSEDKSYSASAVLEKRPSLSSNEQ